MNRLLAAFALAVLLVFALSSLANANCTQGFWKTHEDDWCAMALMLGDELYPQPDLAAIFDQPVEGNGLVALAHQLIAAKLNAACGSMPAAEVGDADALIGPLIIPPLGNGYLPTSQTDSLVSALDAYNNLPGDGSGFGGCEPVSVENFTWGRMKATYR